MKEPNAFALPGGYIYISRGLLAIMNSEDELAAVLGHEIGHVAGRHSAKQQTKSRGWIPLQILAGIGGAAASAVSPGIGEVIASAGQLPASLVLASYSRKQETEADRLGQQYIAAEGWNPAALADTMDALSREQELAGGDPGRMSFFDTHPTTPDRAREGRDYAKTLSVAPENRIAPDRNAFLTRLDGLVLGDSARGGSFVKNHFVHPELGFALTFPPDWTHENTPSAVLAQPKDQSALLVLQMAAEGDDPRVVADQVESQVAFEERSAPTTIHGFPAVTAVSKASQDGQEVYVYLAWIAKGGIVYQVLGAAPTPRWPAHRPTFEQTASSFREPSAAEVAELHEDRLRLLEARANETVSALTARADTTWSLERLAAANGMRPGDRLEAGVLVKLSRRERYRAR
jgi:predicted Zn-dependent protease